MAQSWVTGSPPNDSVATTYFPYLATKLTTGTKYGTHSSSEVGDIYVPNYNGKTPPANANSRPAVLIVHGGGGTSGSRASSREIQMSQFCAAHGYVAFNIDYTIGSVWPKNVYDWRLAIRFLRANAATYGIDPNHIGVIGGSFGGFCAGNLSGITNGQRTIYPDSNASYNNISLDGYSGEALNAYSGDVQVACDLYGPMDQTTSGNAGGIYSSPTTATLKNSSAVQYVHPTSAPLLISHGTSDTTVSISQSEEMTNKLGQASVPYQFKTWSGVGHTFLIYQSSVDLRKQWMDWFDKYLLVSSTPPYIQVQPANQSGCLNNSATFSVTANGSIPLAYQWYGPTNAIAGATNATYNDPSLLLADAGSYYVVITNAYGAVTSSVVTLTVNNLNPPAIATDVADVAVLAGNPATLTITATGDNLQYQWYGPAGLIVNATNANYSITNAAVTDAGTYQVMVYNPCATLPSRLATLTVNGPPAITANPASATNCTGDAVSFVVSATGTAPLAYQWFGPGGSLSGANANSLTLTNLSPANSGTYYCTVTNAYGSVSSDNATLLVSSNADVTFTQQPTDVTVDPGNSASFTVAVSGGGNYSYLWLKNDYDTITNAVATNATLTLTNLSAADSGTYFHCLVNNDCSIFSSANAYVYVNGASVATTTNFASSGTWICPAGVTTVTAQCWGGGGGGGGTTGTSNKRAGGGGAGGAFVQNIAVTVVPGTTYTVTVGAGGSGGGGATATSFGNAGGNSSFSGSGITSVVATGGSGGSPGNSTNYAAGGPGGTGSTAANAGFTIGFSFAGGNGANGVTNQFSGGGGAAAGSFGVGVNATGVTGGTNAVGSIGGAGGAGTSVSGSGQSGSVPGGGGGGGLGGGTNSASGAAGQVTLSYNLLSGSQAPAIVGPPQGVTNASGNSASLQVTASGSPSPTYQWRKDGSPVSGQTAAIYNISSAATTDTGNYDVVVVNSSGSVTSSIAVVLITNAAPFITVQPQNITVSAGATGNFSVTASGSLPLSYQWRRGGSPIGGATSSTYGLSGASLTDSGVTFDVVITNAYGSITSSPPATLTVNAVASVGSVVISQVYSGGSKTNASYMDDYVVLKNISASSVNISGWSLQHDKAGVWQIPYAFTNGNPVLPPGGYYLIQCYRDGSATIGAALPAADEVAPQTSTWNMSYAAADAVALVHSTVNVSNFLSGSAGAVSSASAAAAGIVDLVGSGTSTGNNYFGTGVATGGATNKAISRLNSGCQNTPDNSLDFAAATPNPQNSATTPAPCATPLTQFYQASDNGYGGDVGLENLIYTTTSGTGPYFIWSSTDSSLSVSNWTLEGTMAEFPIANTPNSHYGITVTPGATATYYICAHNRGGPYTAQEPLLILTTSDFFLFYGTETNMPINSAGVFQFIQPNTPPTITQQPVGVTNSAGSTLSLSVIAGGSSPLAYQWYNGVTPIGGAIAATYGVNPTTTNDSGSYTVVITNSYGSITSSVAAVLITNFPPTAPFITQSPQSQSVVAGFSASFSVVAGGSIPLSYQWRRGGVPIGGATTNTYSVSTVIGDSGSTFDMVITNAYGSITSSPVATLMVTLPPAELLSIEAVKSIYYMQTDTNAAVVQPAANKPYSWAGEVQGILPTIITNTTVTFTGTNLPNPFIQSTIDDTGLSQDEIQFSNKAALDAAYSNGNFRYITKFASGNIYTNDIPLGTNGDAYPNAPTLTAPSSDWLGGKLTLHAVAGGYQIGWAAMSAPQDQINIAVNDSSGHAITEINGLPGNITNYVLPGSVFDPNTDYNIELTFTHMNYISTNAMGVILYGLFEANNDFTVHTDSAGVGGGVPVSNYATIRNGVYTLLDISEQSAGYLMAKYSTSGAAAKSYLQFDLTNTNADTSSPATLRLYRASGTASQHIQLWALNQIFSAPTNFNNINWNQAPANDTNSNSMLTSGPATASLLVDMQAHNLTNQLFTEIVIPAPWGQYVFNNKITLAIATSSALAITGDTNASGGFRTVITNSLQLPTLRFSAPKVVQGVTPVLSGGSMLIQGGGGGNVHFGFTGTSGASYTVYYTTNLTPPITWTAIAGGVTESPVGQFNFTDPQAVTGVQRYYRVFSP